MKLHRKNTISNKMIIKMYKRRFFLLTTFLAFSIFKINAQEGYTTMQLTDMIGQLNWERNMREGNPNIKGSPYLHDEFIKGDVYYDKKFKVEQIPLRLNLYNDEFEYQVKSTVMAFSHPNKIDQVVVGEEVFIYLPETPGNMVSGFVRKWNNKSPCLITKMKAEFFNKEDPKPFEETKPDRFERALDKNFIMMSDSEIEKVTSVKKLIKLLGDHSSELTAFAKKEKTSSGNAEELGQLLEYYHQLNQ
jgi:hypothetical protein